MPSMWKDTGGNTKGEVQKHLCNPRRERAGTPLKPRETCSKVRAGEQQSAPKKVEKTLADIHWTSARPLHIQLQKLSQNRDQSVRHWPGQCGGNWAVLGDAGSLSLTSDTPPQVGLSLRPLQAQSTIQEYSVQVSGVKNRRHYVY